jgi:hypothetical protein
MGIGNARRSVCDEFTMLLGPQSVLSPTRIGDEGCEKHDQ